MKKILFADSHYFGEYSMLGQQQYAHRFSSHEWDVAYITNPLSPFNTIFGKDRRLIIRSLLNHIKNGIYIKKNLWNYVPFTFIPFHNHTIFEKSWFFNNYYRFTVPSIKSVIKKKGFSSVDVLWLGTAHQKFLIDIVNYKCCIYRLADNTQEFSKSSAITVKAQEKVIKFSDIVLVTSKVLLKEWKSRFNNKEFVYCPNGVDLSNFIRKEYKKPREYSQITNRIALYIGAIDEWFDQELLMKVARQCQEITFVIIGLDHCGKMKNLLGHNIYYLGPKPYTEIPDYIYYCDCGIIPFNTSKLVQSISPIKMFEFFSLGKPVISREWDELKLIKNPCYLARNVEEFIDILKDENTFLDDSKKLISYAYENTWDKQYLKIVKALEKYSIKIR